MRLPCLIASVAFIGLTGNALAQGPKLAALEESDNSAHVEFFEQRVRPILVKRCQKCHGEKKQEFGLRLDSRAGVVAGSDEGTVVVSGKPSQSKLITAIQYDGDIQMPPKAKLPDEEIGVLSKWVEFGLPWPAEQGGSNAKQPMTGEE